MAGIVGFNVQPTATVSQCGNRGTVNSESVAAGIILYNSGWVYDCYNVGNVIGNRYIAGITIRIRLPAAILQAHWRGIPYSIRWFLQIFRMNSMVRWKTVTPSKVIHITPEQKN